MTLDREQATALAEALKALAQPQRLMILSVLLGGERSVGEIESVTGIGQPALSQQLAELRRADHVTTRREARQVYYSVAGEQVETRLRALFAALGIAVPGSSPGAVMPDSASGRSRTGAATFARIGS
ncbi:metalloregulator ArsR/SmtB family transcription factor [Sphingomonadaceae bacterium jetA1]|uniref:ArsR/SmtB family transcription factor n=1 Tax=Facivitalis istanbulensis TaxID=3075838 RepID=UPI003487A2BC